MSSQKCSRKLHVSHEVKNEITAHEVINLFLRYMKGDLQVRSDLASLYCHQSPSYEFPLAKLFS